jgi:surfactin synthase thioesterase subunit
MDMAGAKWMTVVQKQRPIIFVGHSLGGLVIKDVSACPGEG